jgi:hypothetical protein
MDDPTLAREKSKSPGHALAGRLAHEAGLNPAQVRVAVEVVGDHIHDYYSQSRAPGAITHTAVSASEPAGKPIKYCRVVPVKLTAVHDADVEVLSNKGPVELRMVRLYRLCCEAQEQGGLLSHEDLCVLLSLDRSTVGELIDRWRAQNVLVPTRGAIRDIGREPSHKRIIATLLGRGYSTSHIRAMTRHSEGAIGRYQQQFALVLHLLHTYPQASPDEHCQIASLSRSAYDTYVEVYRELAQRSDCQEHLERLRRRYELDPEGIAYKLPEGKAPKNDPTRRLEQQTLATAVRQTIQDDLATTPRVAEAVTCDVMQLVDQSFRLTDSLRPGEAVVMVDAQDPSYLSGERVADRKVIPVKVPLHTEETISVWRSDEDLGRRRAQIAARIATAASEQGGVCSVANLAELLHVRPATLAKDLRELAVECHVEAPTKGLLEDAGPTLTHKDLIVGLDQFGLTGDEISWLTRHAPHSRDRYIETYRKVETLMRLEGRIPETDLVARTLGLRPHVAQQYVDLLRRYHGADDKPVADPVPAAESQPVEVTT